MSIEELINKKLEEAIEILKNFGMPSEQQNERTAYCLLSLLNITPEKAWKNAENPLVGITPMMTFAKDYYNKIYAPNSRETFRRFSTHLIEQLAPRFLPNSTLIYVGDTGEKWGYYDQELAGNLLFNVQEHGKMPDVILYVEDKRWLVLIEAVTSHGPVDSKRYIELEELFSNVSANKVYISAFPDKKTFTHYVQDIAWETEAWIADNPTHMIHFNGDKFLGPHK